MCFIRDLFFLLITLAHLPSLIETVGGEKSLSLIPAFKVFTGSYFDKICVKCLEMITKFGHTLYYSNYIVENIFLKYSQNRFFMYMGTMPYFHLSNKFNDWVILMIVKIEFKY